MSRDAKIRRAQRLQRTHRANRRAAAIKAGLPDKVRNATDRRRLEATR